MNYIIAIIQPSQLEAVQEKLTAAGVSGMTVTEVRGYGRQRGKTEIYRGTEYSINFLPKIKLELALDDKASAEAVDIITEVCTSGRIGDGKIFTFRLTEALRIRTGETGSEAL